MNASGTVVLTAAQDNTLRLWDGVTGSVTRVLEGHTNWVVACGITGDGSAAVSGSRDNSVRLWTADGSRVLATHSGRVTACKFALARRVVLSAGHDEIVRLSDTATGDCVMPELRLGRTITGCTVSEDLRVVVVATTGHDLMVWSPGSAHPPAVFSGHDHQLSCCAVSADGALALSGSWDGTLRVWSDLSAGRSMVLRGHSGEVTACAMTGDGRLAVSGGDDNSVRLWNTASGEQMAVLFMQNTAATISDNGSTIAVADGTGNVSLFDFVPG
jgi:WD40 repeat protein